MTDPTTSSGAQGRAEPRAFRPVGPGHALGRYELTAELGQGGMASVFRGRDTELRRDVALKVLHPHFAKRGDIVGRFQREARAVAGLDHPHVLRIYDVGSAGPPDADGLADPPYIVMELVAGGNLHDFLVANGAPLGEVVACIGIALCAALEVAHAAGIVHRDVKPANVMIADGGRLVLTDFGVARIADGDSLVTQTGAVIGTPAFMSPEQALGEAVDARSDLYSLGALLYRLASGALPFTGSAPQVMSAIVRGELTPPLQRNPAMGSALARVIERLMARERDARFSSAADARRALEAIVTTAGLGDADAELAAYFAGPGDYNADRRDTIVAATMAAARTAAESRAIPKALDLADRVLALAPDHPDALELVETIGGGADRAGSWKWIAAAAAVVVGAVLAIALRADDGASGLAGGIVDAGAEPDAIAVAAPLADAGAGAVVGVAAPRDAAPSRGVSDARARKLVRQPPIEPAVAPDAAVAVAVVAIDAATEVTPPPVERATVHFDMSAWCDVFIDGTPHGRARRDTPIAVAAGEHLFECTQGKGAPTWREARTLTAGESRVLRGTLLAPIRVTVDVGGDRVRIRGRDYRNGTTIEIAPGRHRVEVFDGERGLGARTVRFTSGRPCTLRDRPELACAK